MKVNVILRIYKNRYFSSRFTLVMFVGNLYWAGGGRKTEGGVSGMVVGWVEGTVFLINGLWPYWSSMWFRVSLRGADTPFPSFWLWPPRMVFQTPSTWATQLRRTPITKPFLVNLMLVPSLSTSLLLQPVVFSLRLTFRPDCSPVANTQTIQTLGNQRKSRWPLTRGLQRLRLYRHWERLHPGIQPGFDGWTSAGVFLKVFLAW